MSPSLWTAIVAALLVITPIDSARSLEIYFIDVEGGQATLIVTPGGGTMLVDAGYAGRGTFQSTGGDLRDARDAQRVAAMAREAGVKRIDYLLVTMATVTLPIPRRWLPFARARPS